MDYLKSLLETLWKEGEGFSGKRPFGNSGWQMDVCAALLRAGLVTGDFDKDGDLVDCDERTTDAIVLAVIKRFVIKG